MAQLYKSDWNRLSAFRFSVLALSLFTSPLSALTPPAQKPFFTLSSEVYVCDDHLPVHTQLLLAWETTGPWLFLFLPPSTEWTSAEAEWRLSNALLSLRILLVHFKPILLRSEFSGLAISIFHRPEHAFQLNVLKCVHVGGTLCLWDPSSIIQTLKSSFPKQILQNRINCRTRSITESPKRSSNPLPKQTSNS